ncbi:MAG: acyl-CoA carboxylase subunit beta, partial [Ferruginibacter sp.]
MDLVFNKNEDANRTAWAGVRQKLDQIALGGGAKAIQKQKEKNKLTARERIGLLLDEDSYFVEIGAFAGFEMYE